jgi:hypothetical protein
VHILGFKSIVPPVRRAAAATWDIAQLVRVWSRLINWVELRKQRWIYTDATQSAERDTDTDKWIWCYIDLHVGHGDVRCQAPDKGPRTLTVGKAEKEMPGG